jgi:cob(I)alamin adenosyltransferase
VVIQFTKGRKDEIGEYRIQGSIPNYEVYQFGRPEFINPNHPAEVDVALARKGLDFARKIAQKRCPDILILDEINIALFFKLISVDEFLNFLDEISTHCEIILTGQKAHPAVIARADLVTEMRKVKHYFDEGVQARQGIEY